MMEPKMIVYVVTNKQNQKQYVGMTTMGLKKRKEAHLCNARGGSQCQFHRAIRKHGEENFEWKVVYVGETEQELFEKEIELIKELDTYHNGMNMTLGGDGVVGLIGESHGQAVITEKQAQKIVDMIHNECKSYIQISEEVGVAHSIVTNIAKGLAWSHLYNEPPMYNRPDGFIRNKYHDLEQEEKVKIAVDMMFRTNKTYREISEETGIGQSMVRQIATGRQWTHLYSIPPAKVRKLRKKWRKALTDKYQLKVNWSEIS